ncbi:MAG: triose-phosphate isomerase [Patescibacteria group bacterium]|nr:triose-phosphate isomerase [Patescibacteria group bacterium]
MKYIVANWKMNLGVRESIALARSVLRSVRGHEETPEIILCPSATSLAEVHKVLARSKVKLGAQDCGPQKSGAYTGEISPLMLKDVGCSHAIIGHSERRALGESDEIINRKLLAALENDLMPILCVGEPLDIRENGGAIEYVQQQIAAALDGVRLSRKQRLFISYEPIWAIGSGKYAEVADVVEMHSVIENDVLKRLDINREQLIILYGGSVLEENVYSFLREKMIDGVLVGGASLKLRQFKGIIDAGREVLTAQSI